MAGRLLSILVCVLLVASTLTVANASGSPPGTPQQQSENVKRGIGHFNRAVFEFTPTHRDTEATREFGLAVAAFEAELKLDPGSVDAHRYLGRLFALRGQSKKAATHFDHLRTLLPADPDVCGMAASAWADAGRFDLARARLLEAKQRTSDPRALALIDGFLARLEERAAAATRQEGR